MVLVLRVKASGLATDADEEYCLPWHLLFTDNTGGILKNRGSLDLWLLVRWVFRLPVTRVYTFYSLVRRYNNVGPISVNGASFRGPWVWGHWFLCLLVRGVCAYFPVWSTITSTLSPTVVPTLGELGRNSLNFSVPVLHLFPTSVLHAQKTARTDKERKSILPLGACISSHHQTAMGIFRQRNRLWERGLQHVNPGFPLDTNASPKRVSDWE